MELTPRPADGLIARLADARPTVAFILFACAAVWAVPVVTSLVWYAQGKAAAAAPADADPPADEKPADDKTIDPNATTYLVTAVLAGIGVMTALGFGVYFLASLPPPTVAQRLADVRKACLLAGGLFGLFLMLLGGWHFVVQYPLVGEWLSTGRPKGAWKPIAALLAFAAGAGLAFVAGLPARAEERNDQTIRRLVYGSGLAVTTLLLVMLLVIGNVIAGVKLPNKLDTTDAGTFTLAPGTEEYIRGLDQPVTVFALIPADDGSALSRDTRALLTTLQEINPARFTVRFFGQLVRGTELTDMRKKFPQADLEDNGLIVAVGEDQTRYSYIRASDLVKRDFGRGGADAKLQYLGESKLIRELLYLTDPKGRPVVYFTQGSGELTAEAGANAPAERSAAQLKAHLEKSNVTVKTLAFNPADPDPKVPDDAAVVAVLDPRTGLNPAAATALRNYMSRPAADGKKGKLIAAVGPHPGSDGKGVRETGLEELLGEFRIRVGDRRVYALHQGGEYPPTLVAAESANEALAARNPIAQTMGDTAYPMFNVRAVEAVTGNQGNPEVQAVPLLMVTQMTWLEEDEPTNFRATITDLLRNAEVQRRKNLKVPRYVGAVANEGGSGRVVVFGSGNFFSDDYTRRIQAEVNPAAQLFGLAVDYLRERPIVDVAVKDYTFYTARPGMSAGPLLWLPLGLTLLTIAGLGVGVWVVRRK